MDTDKVFGRLFFTGRLGRGPSLWNRPVRAANDYWNPICELVTRLGCKSRLCIDAGDGTTRTTAWGTLLIVPVASYLEASEGPYPIREISWVQFATVHVTLRREQPPRFEDVSSEVLASLALIECSWELRSESWSLPGWPKGETLQVIHLTNPYWQRGP